MNQNGATFVTNVQYGPANELLQMTYNGFTETHGYNSLLQMTQFNGVQYSYPAGSNNGKIASQTDTVSGETVTYAYDTLNRLVSAASSLGGSSSQTFGYDGFGNLTSKPPLSINVDANNHITNVGYDVENRMISAPGAQFNVVYGYDGQNKRNYSAMVDTNGYMPKEEFYLYGVSGQKLGTYYLQAIAVGSPYNMTLTFSTVNPASGAGGPSPLAYFRGRLLGMDRLGSMGGRYYPYGEDRAGNPGNDSVRFATYTRDSVTGLDYADQRYYSSQFGRFMSADRYMASGGVADPGSWNRYAYTRGDPVNRTDPSGLQDEGPPPLPPFTYCPDGTTIFFGGSQCPPNNAWGWNIGPTISLDLSSLLRLFLPKTVTGTNDQAKKVGDAYADAVTRLILNPKCHDALTTAGYDATTTLEDTDYRVLPFPNPGVGAQKVSSSSVFINSAGAFFTAVPDAAGQVTLTIPSTTAGGPGTAVTFLSQTSANAFILLHELGHQTGTYGADTDNQVNARNSWLVLDNCFGIKEPGGH